MADESRNFGSSFYDKVCFRILLSKNSLDREKLKKFCLRFVLPSMYRERVWKIMLGVVPLNLESHRKWERKSQKLYLKLANSIKLQYRGKETTIRELHTILFHYTVEITAFRLGDMNTCPKLKYHMALATYFSKVSSTDADAFNLFKAFVLHQRKCTSPSTSKHMRENLESLLKKEDETLYEHLKSMKILDELPVDTWFEKCFVEVLHESSLARVFDKLIGGSFTILPYVATALLVGNRHLLLGLTDASKVSEIFEIISEDASDAAVNKALDMFHFASVLERGAEQRSKTTDRKFVAFMLYKLNI